jgi:beta-N-acetylhexosaminidase
MASGELPWSLAEPLAALVPDTEAMTCTERDDPATVAARAGDRSLVVVVRDPARHAWQEPVVRLARADGDAVVVDVGWPVGPFDRPTVLTRGVAPQLLHRAAQLLAASAW